MENESKQALMSVGNIGQTEPVAINPSASPFKLVVDPVMRAAIKKALSDLIDHHDASLSGYVTNGNLALESYKEYVELFARALRETMESREGVLYLLRSAGIEGMGVEDVNLRPEWRWK